MVYVLTACEQDQFRPYPARKLSAHIPLLCVQWKIPDDGKRNCPKHVEYYSKSKFEKLVNLVGFIIRIHFHINPNLRLQWGLLYFDLQTRIFIHLSSFNSLTLSMRATFPTHLTFLIWSSQRQIAKCHITNLVAKVIGFERCYVAKPISVLTYPGSKGRMEWYAESNTISPLQLTFRPPSDHVAGLFCIPGSIIRQHMSSLNSVQSATKWTDNKN